MKGESIFILGFYPANRCQMSNELIAALAQKEEEGKGPTLNVNSYRVRLSSYNL